METLTKERLIEILGGEIILTLEKRDGIISEILLFYNAEIAKYRDTITFLEQQDKAKTELVNKQLDKLAKYKELVEAQKELISLQTISSTTDFDVHTKLRRKIADIESEVKK